jgi:glutathione S-transferase
MKLIGGYISPFTCRILIQIEAKALDIPLVDAPGGLHSDEYRALNPIDKIPALELDDGTIIPESQIIADYLEAEFPQNSMIGTSGLETASINLVARVFDLYVMTAMLPIFGYMDPKSRDQQILDPVLRSVLKGIQTANEFVQPGPFAVEDRLTAAECAAAPILFYADRFLPMFGMDRPFEHAPNVAGYWAEIETSAPVKSVLDRMRSAFGG